MLMGSFKVNDAAETPGTCDSLPSLLLAFLPPLPFLGLSGSMSRTCTLLEALKAEEETGAGL